MKIDIVEVFFGVCLVILGILLVLVIGSYILEVVA